MADLEAVLADVSYLMAMEKSKCTPAARASKKIVLPDPRYALLTATRFPAALRAVRYSGGEGGGGGRGSGGGGGGPSVRLSVCPLAHPLEDLSPFPASPSFFRLFSSLSALAPGINNVYKQNRGSSRIRRAYLVRSRFATGV